MGSGEGKAEKCVDGRDKMEDVEWRTENGEWRMENGEWGMDGGWMMEFSKCQWLWFHILLINY